jgi:anti-anti-sigma factor
MEITREQALGGWVELRVNGRLDSYWADHFKAVLEEVVRSGALKVRVNLAGVGYISSAGITVLIWCHKHLDSVRGKLVITNPSEAVTEILDATRLGEVLTIESSSLGTGRMTTVALGRRVLRERMIFEVFGSTTGPGLSCRVIGSPQPILEKGFGPEDCRTVQFSASSLGVGLGALGKDFGSCRDRFGEFLVAAGAAAYLPTDGSNVPDYLVTAADTQAELQVCYGLACEGAMPGFARFEAEPEVGRVPLSALVQGFLDVAKADRIGLVLLAEAASLMGAALRRSPVAGSVAGSPFTFPQVRDWLSFTAERAHDRSTALVVGVAVRGEAGPLAPLLRPLDREGALQGHFHAAAFSYRPLPRGELELRPTVTALFEQQSLQGLLHLLADHREAVGLGESEFVRGGGWFSPLGAITEAVP